MSRSDKTNESLESDIDAGWDALDTRTPSKREQTPEPKPAALPEAKFVQRMVQKFLPKPEPKPVRTRAVDSADIDAGWDAPGATTPERARRPPIARHIPTPSPRAPAPWPIKTKQVKPPKRGARNAENRAARAAKKAAERAAKRAKAQAKNREVNAPRAAKTEAKPPKAPRVAVRKEPASSAITPSEPASATEPRARRNKQERAPALAAPVRTPAAEATQRPRPMDLKQAAKVAALVAAAAAVLWLLAR
jgi:hypothetical protein